MTRQKKEIINTFKSMGCQIFYDQISDITRLINRDHHSKANKSIPQCIRNIQMRTMGATNYFIYH